MSDAPPPSYNDVTISNRTVVDVEPNGYTAWQEPQRPVNMSPGGLRLDKGRRIGDRLIFDFEKVSCCPYQTTGLEPDCKNFIPHELAEKGIASTTWYEWCKDLMKIQKKSPSVAGCLCIFCCPGLLAQAILCVTFCPISANHCFSWLPCCYGDWNNGLDKWQRQVNETLNRKEMHVKLRTYKPFQKAPKSLHYGDRIVGNDHNYEMSMMEIALTVEECRKMQAESWDVGVNDGCTSGKGRII